MQELSPIQHGNHSVQASSSGQSPLNERGPRFMTRSAGGPVVHRPLPAARRKGLPVGRRYRQALLDRIGNRW